MTGAPCRRWVQFGLRTLLVVVALAGVAALVWRSHVEPYRRQRQTMALVGELGGRYETADSGARPWPLLGGDSQNIVLVDLADCDDPAAYLEHVLALPAVETLVVGGLAFADEHLRRLHGLATLRGLVLDSTSVSAAGIAQFQQALPQVKLHLSQRRASVALQKLGSTALQRCSSPWQSRPVVGDDYYWRVTEFGPADPAMADGDTAWLRTLIDLRHLRLDFTQVSDTGLARVPPWPISMC